MSARPLPAPRLISLFDDLKAGPPLSDYSLLCGHGSLVGACDRLFLGEALFHQIRQIDFNRLRREFSLVLLTRHVAPDSFDLILIPGGTETSRQHRRGCGKATVLAGGRASPAVAGCASYAIGAGALMPAAGQEPASVTGEATDLHTC